ncbi:hypothetical protein M5E06_21025 [Azospirillum sp. A1-3]|uniref:hypothetical protein n=1 Tax=Azospirillum sp. A1-3 TaxID=185874 RepID=UPI002076F220|nr:hypothetical protein [Azospirillum sp. A1-3]MCM8736613.1 hypothetical protein [Azospirillum sp. A1-3]
MAGPQPTWQRGDLLARFTIPGEPAAKGNSREIVKFGDKVALRKGNKALDFEAVAALHVTKLPEPYEGDVAVHVRVFYASRRPDLDASLVYDALQTRRVKVGAGFILEPRLITNDRQVRLKIEEGFVDKARPRVEVAVYKATQKLVGGAA